MMEIVCAADPLMLLSLHISNFALIDELMISFDRGLNVLTGETGAGKSIILDAIDALLGGSINARLIRSGADRASLIGTFGCSSELSNWLTINQIPDQPVLTCAREISKRGGSLRSRLRVNGILINKQALAELREFLVEITGQGQTSKLIASHQQRQLLDAYGGLEADRQQVTQSFQAWQQTERQLQEQQQFQQNYALHLANLQQEVQELEAAGLETGDELTALEQEHHTLNHVVDLQQQSYQIYQLLYQSDSGEVAATDLLAKAENLLIGAAEIDPQLQPVLEAVSDSLAMIIDAGRQINSYGDRLEADPKRLAEIEERMRYLKHLCRKYGCDLPALIDRFNQSQAALTSMVTMGSTVAELQAKLQAHYEALLAACNQLTQRRQQTAAALESQLVAELQPLGMAKVQFQVEIQPQSPGNSGADAVCFLFSPNPGEPLQSLAATASGGEMSRFLLALKSCFSAITSTGTLIFDEIDTGVSGKITQSIADKLRQLATDRQVLCVTHQPIMAAMADVHFQVRKEGAIEQSNGKSQRERTVVKIERLESQRRREEIAQLAGGYSVADSIAFADALLSQATASKKSQLTITPTIKGRKAAAVAKHPRSKTAKKS
jgi:DNA repair protein RecN (Recombination protein N)